MARESVLRSAEPQQNPGFAGVLRFGENQGAVREGYVIRENRAPTRKFQKSFRRKHRWMLGFAGVWMGCGKIGVDGWEGRPYMRLHQHGAAGSSGPLVLLEDFELVAK
jgi:hypothetical protein